MSFNPNEPSAPGAEPRPAVAPDPNRTVIMPQGGFPNATPPSPQPPVAAPPWSSPGPDIPWSSPPIAPPAPAAKAHGMSPSAYGLFAAAALTVLAMFLPLVVVGNESASVFSAVKGTFVFYLVLAGLMVVVALRSKKLLHILSLLIGLAVAGLALNYRSDASTFGISAGAGIWALLLGGLVCVGASIFGLVRSR